ncbi:MAG: MATE family efflux transporter [Hungatella sp.]|nr:MATE family efflux transporter [Hungatella sp.]
MSRGKDRGRLLATLLTLSIPTMVEEILATLLQYVDTAMVGQLGEQATASVSITTTINWLVGSIAGAIGTGILAMISRAVGSGDQERIRSLSKQALFLATGCGLVTGSVCIVLSPFIPVWMGAEPAIQAQASRYFFIISLPMVFRTWTTILGASIRATQNTRTPMVISMTANGLNVVLNYGLIYGAGMGVTGAALASALSYALSGILMFAAYRRSAVLSWKWKDFQVEIPLLKECAVIGGPVLGTTVTSCMGYVVFAGLVSGMGTTIFAAHSIAVTAETIFYIPGYGLRTATSALTGAALGEKNQEKLKNTGYLSVALTVGMMCLSGLTLYLVAYPLMRLFTPSETVASLGASMLRLVALSEPFFGLMIVLEGIFYGLGRTRYAFVVETFSMWGIRIFFTFLCVRVWRLDLQAVWFCMIGDNVCKALLFALPVTRRKQRERLFSVTG